MKFWLSGCAAVAACAATGAHAQATHSLEDDAAAFGARPAVIAPSLSPGGTRVLYLTPGPGTKTFAVISDLQSGKSNVTISTDGQPESLRWCDYSAEDRLVCRVSGNILHSGVMLGFQRLFSVDSTGGGMIMLGQKQSVYDEYLRQFDADILDWRSRTDGQVLMEREYVPEAGKMNTRLVRSKEGLGVDLVDTRNARAAPVEQPHREASSYMSDGRGDVRIMQVMEVTTSGTMTGRVKYEYRLPGSHDWKSLVDYADSEAQIIPLAVDADINALYALKNSNGRKALYTIKLDGGLAEALVASNPRVDIDNVVRVGAGMKVIGYTYAEEARHAVYFDPEFKALSESLSKVLPNLPLVDFVGASADGRKLLIFAGSDTDPGRYYLFDRDSKTLNEAMFERPQLAGRTLAEVKSVTVPASDGTPIPAYLTLPPGKAAKGLPAVVLPHGGPSARDEWGFDWIAQFLAARGYAVIQPEYRGSAGFGDAWLNENGFRSWRTSMGDVAASARWLGSQGIADPKRVAIVGWSYGGYAALLEAETDPSLYKAVVAIAPVTDLQMLKDEAAVYTNKAIVDRFIGSGPHVDEGSPLRHADKVQAPVLLVHGDLDSNVAVNQSQKMDSALRSAGKQVQYLEYKGLDHQLNDSTVRAEVLTHIGQLLDRTIGH